jgi:hypothetical protein
MGLFEWLLAVILCAAAWWAGFHLGYERGWRDSCIYGSGVNPGPPASRRKALRAAESEWRGGKR